MWGRRLLNGSCNCADLKEVWNFVRSSLEIVGFIKIPLKSKCKKISKNCYKKGGFLWWKMNILFSLGKKAWFFISFYIDYLILFCFEEFINKKSKKFTLKRKILKESNWRKFLTFFIGFFKVKNPFFIEKKIIFL